MILSCNSSANKSANCKTSDTVISRQILIAAFDKDEKAAMDSIYKYQLDSVYKICLKYLYVIYGNEVLYKNGKNEGLTIGECNIRIVEFRNKSGELGEMTYGVFLNDSIPVNVVINTSSGQMINGFDVDVEKRKIVFGSIGESGKIDITNVVKLYNNASKNKLFTDYINKYKERLHPKFIKLLNEPLK
jgi:hypothetical protein